MNSTKVFSMHLSYEDQDHTLILQYDNHYTPILFLVYFLMQKKMHNTL